MFTQQSWFRDWLGRAWPSTHAFVFNEKWVYFLPIIPFAGIATAVFVFVAALAEDADGTKGKRFLFLVNDVGHLVLLFLVAFFFIPRLEVGRPHRHSRRSDPVNRAVQEFKTWMTALVVCWFFFYVCRTVVDLPDAFLGSAPGLSEALTLWKSTATNIADTLNVIGALAIFALYTTAEYARTVRWTVRARLSVPLVIVGLGMVFQIIAGAPYGADAPLNQLARIVNGLIVGVATALLIGRLDSKYIGLHKAVVIVLYCYALIQPLLPYVFQPRSDSLSRNMQYVFVAAALVMKSILIFHLGKIIDNGTLRFYISSMQWLDKHAATLRALHQSAFAAGDPPQGGPNLFCLVPPGSGPAKINVARSYVMVELGILNAWLGVSWEIGEFSVDEVQISGERFDVSRVDVIRQKSAPAADSKSVRVSEERRYARITLGIQLVAEDDELRERLRRDPEISQALGRQQKARVTVTLIGLRAETSLLNDERETDSFPQQLLSVELEDSLVYKAIV